MRIGIIVDGESEFRSLPFLIKKLESVPSAVLNPLRADIHPYATPKQIARAAASRLPILAGRGVTHAVVLVDREKRNDCPGALAQELATELGPACARHMVSSVSVVIKDRQFENWLIADTGALKRLRQRFAVSEGTVRSIRRGGADQQDGLLVLGKAAKKSPYAKVQDSIAIMTKADPIVIAKHSRSFRRFLRVLGHPTYLNQSRLP